MCVATVIEKTTNTATAILCQLSLHLLKVIIWACCNRVLVWFGKFSQCNRHVNGTMF